MDLQQVYAAVGGDLADTAARLGGEERVAKYVARFTQDPSYTQLTDALAAGDTAAAFRAAHTLKGLCLTLGLGDLTCRASEMTEQLRGGDLPAAQAALPALRTAYAQLAALTQE